jgi:tRNA-splicing ligase RtcB
VGVAMIYDSGKIPIKMWLNEIESGARKQALNLANLPFAFKHIAIMPDCLSDDTEILTRKGFKKITDLSGQEKIANYDPFRGSCFFLKPKNIIIRSLRKNEKMFQFTNVLMDKSILVSENHRMAFNSKMGIAAKDVPIVTELKDYTWGAWGIPTVNSGISDELICLIAWVVGDGNIKKNNLKEDNTFSSIYIRFGLTKERKIKRISNLLDALEMKYTISKNSRQTTITINKEDSGWIMRAFVGEKKQYPISFLTSLSRGQAEMFLLEALRVDGDWSSYEKCGRMRFNSKRKEDIDFLAALISLNVGIAKDNTRETNGYKKIKMHYLDVIKNSTIKESASGKHKEKVVKKEIKYSGKVVCVTCDSGFFIARQKGMTFVTGNCHQGYGMPIGGVMAAKDVVIPNAVGVDIGCGVCAVKTTAKNVRSDTLRNIMGGIRRVIPVGFKKHKYASDGKDYMPELKIGDNSVCGQEWSNAAMSIGTLGGGNHFIEIQKDEQGFVWIMLHSGSRNLGLKVAEYYNKLAISLNEKWRSDVPKDWELAFLPSDSEEGQAYLREMKFCVDFAFNNRKLMMDRIKEVFCDSVECEFGDMSNIAHNYAAMENHFGKNVMVHRKGATRARLGEYGLIPGSQGTSSYVVEGLGNPDSFMSCSHGAGRLMSRKKAKQELNYDEQIVLMGNVVHGMRSSKDLDEAPGAYKNIDAVMENQKDLVSILHKLTPLAVIKG